MKPNQTVNIVEETQPPAALSLPATAPAGLAWNVATPQDENMGLLAKPAVEPLVRELLLTLGEDPGREGLKRTPERVARMYLELLAGYETDLDSLVNGAVFETEVHEPVLVRDMRFFSLCEHHLLPFFGQAHVAYIPDGKIIGLSKIPRLVEMFARRLQVQERMTQQIAETLQDILQPRGVAVLVEGAHLCAMMRGVRQTEARMLTSAMLGAFRTEEGLRQDFYSQLRLHASTGEEPGAMMIF